MFDSKSLMSALAFTLSITHSIQKKPLTTTYIVAIISAILFLFLILFICICHFTQKCKKKKVSHADNDLYSESGLIPGTKSQAFLIPPIYYTDNVEDPLIQEDLNERVNTKYKQI